MVKQTFDLIVIGAGSAGLSAASFAARLGKRVALIEKDKLGGDCTWTGCVPSKTLLHLASAACVDSALAAAGILVAKPRVDMKKVAAHIQATIEEIYAVEESPQVLENKGITVVMGAAEFVDPHTVQVADKKLTAPHIIIATGARPRIPHIDGLESIGYHTNHTIFANDTLPKKLVIVGAGPISMELGQAYQRLGSQVCIVGSHVMPHDEPEVSQFMQYRLESEGVQFIAGHATTVTGKTGAFTLTTDEDQQISGDLLLLAAGRVPNIEGLQLEVAGVQSEKNGIPTNDQLQTNVSHIYAVGDVAQGPQFTHYAGFQGSIAARNILLPFSASGKKSDFPWVTFTSPEAAHVGMTEQQAREAHGGAVKTHTFSLKSGDRSRTEADEGFIKLIYTGRGKLLGASIVASRAGEMILELQLAVEGKLSLQQIAQTMHAYPTHSEVVRKAVAEVVTKELFSSTAGSILKFVAQFS